MTKYSYITHADGLIVLDNDEGLVATFSLIDCIGIKQGIQAALDAKLEKLLEQNGNYTMQDAQILWHMGKLQ